MLDELLESVRRGHSAVLVLRGEEGVGKTALLDYIARRARGCRLARVTGTQSEMELVFAGLHQLCAPMLDHAGNLPAPQQDALRTALGIDTGTSPDRFLVGLATLSLLSEAAGQRPLICLVDDEQWLDRASAQALGFAARRLAAEPVGLVFAAREASADLATLPELVVEGLADDDARALLESTLAGPLDPQVRDLIVAETRGNPLALLELPRGLGPAKLAGGFGLPGAAPLAGRIEESFARQLDALPDQTRRLLQLAAADPSGDQSLVWRAAGRLGIPLQIEMAAEKPWLAEFGTRAGIRFRHPLARSAAYRSASLPERKQIHAALAEVTDPQVDPDRRAWHRAQAATGPDEDVAVELERSAGRARARGGLAAAAAFLEHAVLLTDDRARRAGRAMAAAQTSMRAGAFGKALELLAMTEAEQLHELDSARVDLLRAQIAFVSGLGGDAPPLLLKAAERLEPLNLDLARETYVIAWMAALFAGHLAGAGDLLQVSRAARSLPPPTHPPRPVDLVLDGLALLVTEGPGSAAKTLRQAVSAFVSPDIIAEEELRWGWLARAAASVLWDEDAWRVMLIRQLRLARDAGALYLLPIVLGALAMSNAWRGEFAAAESLITEAEMVREVTGSRIAPYAAMFAAALRGDEAEAVPLFEATIVKAKSGKQGLAVGSAHRAAAILYNGLCRYDAALTAARLASEDTSALHVSVWVLPELTEAAVRSGAKHVAEDAVERLAIFTQAGATDFGLGIEARCRALVSDPSAAEDWYREAIDRLGRTRLRPELARAHLLYGEWLRRENRRVNARAQLRIAHEMLDTIGMRAFAERARRELLATGESVRRRTVENATTLTAQEEHIARLAGEGKTSAEIGAQLFLSARTVEWHLGKVFAKLGIASRRQLNTALLNLAPSDEPPR